MDGRKTRNLSMGGGAVRGWTLGWVGGGNQGVMPERAGLWVASVGSLPGVALGSSWKGAVRACLKDRLWPVAVVWNEGAGPDSQLIGKLGPEKEFQSSASAFLVLLSLCHRVSLPSPTLSIPSGCTARIGKWERGCVLAEGIMAGIWAS